MKKFIWKFFIKPLFQAFIDQENKSYCLSENKIFKQKTMLEKRKATLMNYKLGTKVILRSNEPNDLIIGEVVGHTDIGEDREILLQIKDETTGKVWSSLDNRPPLWSQEKEEALKKLNWAEQWNAMMPGSYLIDPEFKKRREEDYATNHPDRLTKNV